ncbi:MAG: hypothetical protein KF696_09175 [Planctomycetes bacterium]|nr:hypothetical protein [Planctomycetota bacterium]MCW8136758.1 hypothetical protein [Planctomycetota bacterium]
MRKMKWMLVVAAMFAIAAVAAPLSAQMGGKSEEPSKEKEKKEEPENPEDADKLSVQLKKNLKGIEDVTGKVEFTEADLKATLKHHADLDKLFEGDEKFETLKQSNMKEAFDYIVKNEKYVAWAKKNEVDADAFMRKTLRLRTNFYKLYLPDYLDGIIKKQREMMEGFKDMIPEDEYKTAMAELDKAAEDFKACRKILEGVPGPTDAEKKLIEANKKELAKIFELEEEEEDGDDEDEDGMK